LPSNISCETISDFADTSPLRHLIFNFVTTINDAFQDAKALETQLDYFSNSDILREGEDFAALTL
jgi:hypothetical protein